MEFTGRLEHQNYICRQLWLCTTNIKFYRKQYSAFVDGICERTANLVITLSFAALYAKTHVIRHAGLCRLLGRFHTYLFCYHRDLVSHASNRPAQMTEGRKLPFCLAVWHVRLFSSNYECNNETCFWPDVIWYTKYNHRKGCLFSCKTLNRSFFDLFLQLPLHFLLFCLFLLFLFLLLLLLTMERIWITFGHFAVSCVLLFLGYDVNSSHPEIWAQAFQSTKQCCYEIHRKLYI